MPTTSSWATTTTCKLRVSNYRRLSRCKQLGGLVRVSWLGVPPRYKASKFCYPLKTILASWLNSHLLACHGFPYENDIRQVWTFCNPLGTCNKNLAIFGFSINIGGFKIFRIFQKKSWPEIFVGRINARGKGSKGEDTRKKGKMVKKQK